MSELVRDLAKQIAEALADDRYRQAQDELQALAGELADWSGRVTGEHVAAEIRSFTSRWRSVQNRYSDDAVLRQAEILRQEIDRLRHDKPGIERALINASTEAKHARARVRELEAFRTVEGVGAHLTRACDDARRLETEAKGAESQAASMSASLQDLHARLAGLPLTRLDRQMAELAGKDAAQLAIGDRPLCVFMDDKQGRLIGRFFDGTTRTIESGAEITGRDLKRMRGERGNNDKRTNAYIF